MTPPADPNSALAWVRDHLLYAGGRGLLLVGLGVALPGQVGFALGTLGLASTLASATTYVALLVKTHPWRT